MYAYEIDGNGFIIDNYDMNGEVEIPSGCINVQLPIPLLFYKPKWNGSKWTEGATRDEIDEMTKSQPSPPRELDILTNYVLDVDMRLVMVEMGLI